MNRLCTLVGSTVVVGLVGSIPPASAQTAAPRVAGDDSARRVARAVSGHIEGVVVDERGSPLPGALVSVLGSTSAMAVTDRRGSFVLSALPPGAYMVRAHLTGFAPSRRQVVDVRTSGASRFTLTMQRSGKAAGPVGAAPTQPRLLAASLGVDGLFEPAAADPSPKPEPAAAKPDSAAKDDPADDHSERAWRLRHLPRSVLKDATERVKVDPATAGPDDTTKATSAAIARAMGTPVRFFNDLPLTGQVNFVTSGSFDGMSSSLSADSALRGTAYLGIGGPVSQYGDWSARVVTQADLGSWFLAGAFRSRATSRHFYDVGFSYSTQRFAAAPVGRWPLVDPAELGGRAAGVIYGVGRLVLSPRLSVEYGGRFSRYDYLSGPGLFSPSIAVTIVPIERLRVRAALSRRMLAPGAEEFLEPLTHGLWVPPDRTFVEITPARAERTNHFEVAVERDLPRSFVVAVRTFYQDTSDQQLAEFGRVPLGQDSLHYGVGNAGDVVTRGWSVGVTHSLLARVRGSVAYQMTSSSWSRPGVGGGELVVLGVVARPYGERLHDVATSVETDIPLTATHVFMTYRINTGFVRREAEAIRPGLDTRFDLQVTQPLPFLDFTSANWQVLVAVRNLFRETARDSSVYDELLVVRPPTRVVGGVVVRF
jgi:hypothetical protein